jgi:hypothetical protein
VKEWVQFHHDVGWNHIVIYDDNSTDGLKDALQTLPPSWVTVRAAGNYRRRSRHVQSNLQLATLKRCVDEFWNVSEAIAFFDVDEFVFPCKDHWAGRNISQMWSGALQSVASQVAVNLKAYSEACVRNQTAFQPTPFTLEFPCLRYGLNGNARAVSGNESVLETYVRR